MSILPWMPYIEVVGVVATLIMMLMMAFIGPATIPEKWQTWQNKMRANPRPMLSVLCIIDVVLVYYMALNERSCYKPQSRCSIRRHFTLVPFPIRVFARHSQIYILLLEVSRRS
jgi:hypothetical protein